MAESLSDKLKALGFIPAVEVKKNRESPREDLFAQILGAQEITNRLGTTYLVVKHYPLDYQHGTISFNHRSGISQISAASRVNTDENDLNHLLFLDTETTGLSGGTGTLPFLVGLGYFTSDGFELKQYILKDPSGEPALLQELMQVCENFTSIVTFNGKAFDIPLLKTRYVLNRFPNPFQDKAHFDLLFLSRRIWKNRLQSRALKDLEQEILDIPRSKDEVPGWMIPEIYFTYLRNNDPTSLKGVIYHNGMDILSLAALFLHISTSIQNIHESDQFDLVDYYSFGVLFSDLGLTDIAQTIFLECDRKNTLPVHLKLALYKNLGGIYRSQQMYERALDFWIKASEMEDIESSVEIAKYYEHVLRDYSSAQTWTETAITFLSRKGYHTYQEKRSAKDLTKRKDRLLKKMERINGDVYSKTP